MLTHWIVETRTPLDVVGLVLMAPGSSAFCTDGFAAVGAVLSLLLPGGKPEATHP